MSNRLKDHERIVVGPEQAPATIILAHGAGAGMDTDFMNAFAEGLADHDFRVVRFEFPYMAERRQTGKRRPPDREPVLRQTWLDVIASVEAKTLFIGGKSMGGRIASLIADEASVAGLICLGYPFHPTGKPDQLRVEHLQAIKTPTLILQGERDSFGNAGEVRGYELSSQIRLHWLPDGDHSFKPRVSSGHTQEENRRDAISVIASFVRRQVR
ncbi:MAG: alpha/beta fold hydrolase [Planctomycetota bacterium]|nr:alpha/beta fold hydrolase [Planctomycetota bacterium]